MSTINRTVVCALILAWGVFSSGGLVLAQDKTRTNSRIVYHNGGILPGTANVYVIWYGCWRCGYPGSDAETQSLLLDFITSFGGSPYAAINTTYPRSDGVTPSGNLIYGGAFVDEFSHGSQLTDAHVAGIVTRAIDGGALPVDSRGIYIVMLSSDVSLTGITDGRCQFHGPLPLHGFTFAHGAVVNASRAPSICAPQFSTEPSPNGNVAADAMASWLAHVINGAITNPTGRGWYDRYGLENSDKCQGTFGDIYLTPTGARANMQLGTHDFLIQQNWINDGRGRCGLQF